MRRSVGVLTRRPISAAARLESEQGTGAFRLSSSVPSEAGHDKPGFNGLWVLIWGPFWVRFEVPAMVSSASGMSEICVSIVVPVCDEEENVAPLIDEIVAAFPDRAGTEILYIDDGSRDGTAKALSASQKNHPNLRILTHGQRSGQSRAIRSGVLAARGRLIGVLDGDGQNDPADLPRLIALFDAAQARGERIGMVMGERKDRQDTGFRRFISRFANACNRGLLKHQARDVGCGLKIVSADLFRRLAYFDHMHRFMPALVGREGFTVLYAPVNHRARPRGASKYGTLDRAFAGIIDLIGVYWLVKRSKRPEVTES